MTYPYEKTTKVVKTGNSLAVVVPAALVRKFGLKPSDTANVAYDLVTGEVKYTFINMRQLSLV